MAQGQFFKKGIEDKPEVSIKKFIVTFGFFVVHLLVS